MTRDVDNPKRCTHTHRQRNGTTIECSDVGHWTLDKANKTWRPAAPGDKSRRCWTHGPGSETKPIGKGGRRRTQPNARIQLAAGILLDLAPEFTKAIQDIHDELSVLGFPSSTNRGTSYIDAPDPAGNDAVRITDLTSSREDLRDWLTDLQNRINAGVLLIARIRKINYAHGAKLCCENQQGRQGSIEWGDPTCTELPVQNGLCPRCYQNERRWRQQHEMPAREEPAA
jgi:hypothetical protein